MLETKKMDLIISFPCSFQLLEFYSPETELYQPQSAAQTQNRIV